MSISATRPDDPIGVPHRAWLQVVLVFLFMLINYADKSVIGLASAPIMRELGLTHRQFGALGSAFFLLFALSGVAVGFLANRLRTKTLLLGMAIVWAVALLPIGIVSSFSLLLVSRVILGAAEGPSFPVALHAVYKWFPDARRPLPTSIVASGAAFGTGIVAPVITWVIVSAGWHAAFCLLGVAGLLWASVWLAFGCEGPLDAAPLLATRWPSPWIPYRELLFSRTALGVFLAGFGAYWVIALNLIWLANYLGQSLHLTAQEAAWIIGLPSLLQMVLAPSFAWVSQRLILAGHSSRAARGGLGAACVVACGGAMVVMALVPMGLLKIVSIGLCFSIGSVIFTLGSTLVGEISPAAQRAAMLGITNSVQTLAGLAAPFVMGYVIDGATNPGAGFKAGFIATGTLVILLGLTAAVLIDPKRDLQRFAARHAS